MECIFIDGDVVIDEMDHEEGYNEDVQVSIANNEATEPVNQLQVDGANLTSLEIENHPFVEVNEESKNFSNHVPAPYVGLQYPFSDEAYQMYNINGKHKGFGIQKHSTYLSKKTGIIISRVYVCNKQGVKIYDATKPKVNDRREQRTHCKAQMSITLNQDSGIWVVLIFRDEHNHEFSTPSQKGKHRSQKSFHKSAHVKDLRVDLYEGGFLPTAISKVVNLHGSGEEETVTPQQCHDHLRTKRSSNIGKECTASVKHFQGKRKTYPLFFFEMEIDDDDQTLRSVFWADGRAITSFLEFGDVVVFDVTYRTNKFSMPFAPFTGVNHHRQSTLFGCALLADEKKKTFVWLFKQWLHCMSGKAPKAIITYQDTSICNAIKIVFPDTRHRYCSWHVDKHATEQLHLLRSNNNPFHEDYKTWFESDYLRIRASSGNFER